jgi:hypothetical protein
MLLKKVGRSLWDPVQVTSSLTEVSKAGSRSPGQQESVPFKKSSWQWAVLLLVVSGCGLISKASEQPMSGVTPSADAGGPPPGTALSYVRGATIPIASSALATVMTDEGGAVVSKSIQTLSSEGVAIELHRLDPQGNPIGSIVALGSTTSLVRTLTIASTEKTFVACWDESADNSNVVCAGVPHSAASTGGFAASVVRAGRRPSLAFSNGVLALSYADTSAAPMVHVESLDDRGMLGRSVQFSGGCLEGDPCREGVSVLVPARYGYLLVAGHTKVNAYWLGLQFEVLGNPIELDKGGWLGQASAATFADGASAVVSLPFPYGLRFYTLGQRGVVAISDSPNDSKVGGFVGLSASQNGVVMTRISKSGDTATGELFASAPTNTVFENVFSVAQHRQLNFAFVPVVSPPAVVVFRAETP